MNSNQNPNLLEICDHFRITLPPRQPYTRANVILALEQELRRHQNHPAACGTIYSGDHVQWRQKQEALQSQLNDLRAETKNMETPPAVPKQHAVHEPAHKPVQNPVQPAQPIPNQPFPSAPSAKSAVKNPATHNYLPNQNALDADSALGKFRLAIRTFKEAIADLSENGSPDKVRKKIYDLLTPILDLQSKTSSDQPHPSQTSQKSHSAHPSQQSPASHPSDYDRLEQEIITASLKKPRSKLDQLPAEKQQILFDLLQEHDPRNIRPVIERDWNLTTSESALHAFKKRHQAKLDAAEAAKLQAALNAELSALSTSDAPDYAQAAEKILQQHAIKTVKNPKSTPEQIYKTFTALTRYTNSQTSRQRLDLQKQKSRRRGDESLTNSAQEQSTPTNEPSNVPTASSPSSEISNSQFSIFNSQ